MHPLDLNKEERSTLSHHVQNRLEEYRSETAKLSLSDEWDIEEVKSAAAQFSFESSHEPKEVLDTVMDSLCKYAVHTPHPSYFGLFNPRPSFMSALGDYIAATTNPQMAAWSHSPYANEIENHIIQGLGEQFGYNKESIDGTFCTGGAESNYTAILCAINDHIPDFNEKGLVGRSKQPIIYCSEQSHHSVQKGAKMAGLGTVSVKEIAVDADLRMNIAQLSAQIAQDKRDGHQPFMVVGTAGTTGAGVIDDLEAIADVADREQLWFHVDGAYGAAICLSKAHKSSVKGIEASDSVTLDIHKWLSVPMGCSVMATRHTDILHKTFSIQTNYMPEDGDKSKVVDPYIHSVQWSRRSIGLKAYLPLAVHGWAGYESIIDKQIDQAQQMRVRLVKDGWTIENDTIMPIICFSHPDFLQDGSTVSKFVAKLISSGKTWCSIYPIKGRDTIRICINNYATTSKEIEDFHQLLVLTKDAV